MQNAQRAKELKEFEFERADVKDDGQWEVAQEVRDAWRLISGSSWVETFSSLCEVVLMPSMTDNLSSMKHPTFHFFFLLQQMLCHCPKLLPWLNDQRADVCLTKMDAKSFKR
jgi:hypothetical protein